MRRFIFALILIGCVAAQPKAGQCPPPSQLGVCATTCYQDYQCLGTGKCCSTSCGGSICVPPIFPQPQVYGQKAGYCPSTPQGPWVCSSRCAKDSDCPGRNKCCRNRCGAMACIKPENH